ncbi:hypothetical protein ACVBEH_14320 [Roseateles sp. GG27B]
MLTPQDYAAALAEVLGATAPLPARLGALLRWLPCSAQRSGSAGYFSAHTLPA